jgi:hypothetical protein
MSYHVRSQWPPPHKFHACFVISEPLWTLLSSGFATSCCLLEIRRRFGETLTLEAVPYSQMSSRCWYTRRCHNTALCTAITKLFVNKGRSETCGRPGTANSLELLKTDILEDLRRRSRAVQHSEGACWNCRKSLAEILTRVGNWVYSHRKSHPCTGTEALYRPYGP